MDAIHPHLIHINNKQGDSQLSLVSSAFSLPNDALYLNNLKVMKVCDGGKHK